ncbi:hypothetical protein G9A89_016755 [Geosiphon pyriformis]|nr:hypothetical protein G9A89_016755 [Geosiphon pyriformis]
MTADDPAPGDEELYSSWALLIQTSLLIGALWTSYYLQIKKIRAIHETVVSIFAGMFVGLILRLSPGLVVQKMVTFNPSYFFNLLLPPIILNSGYELKRENFFRNFGTILTFALIGTFISALVTGFLVAFLGLIGIVALSFLDSMIFGAILSATDPVTVLAIFQTLKVDPKLYSVIFGESIMNDAVAIVLFQTLKQFEGKELHLSNIIRGIGTFLGIFTASLWIGIIIALLCALISFDNIYKVNMLKYSQLHKYPAIESCMIGLIAYNSYFFSNGLKMSGIVSLLFCGITLKHYAYDNMSLRAKRTTKYMFHVMAQLSENFIFIYLGLTLFTLTDLHYKPFFIFFTAIIICLARYCAVFPLANIINAIARYRKRAEHLPHAHQVMLFWAGLRGAVAFALAADLSGDHAPSMRTTILVVVVLSVIVFGGTTSRMLEILKIRIGVEDEDSADSDYEESNNGRKSDEFDEEYNRNLHKRGTNRNGEFYFDHSPEISLESADSVISIENNGLLTTSATSLARTRADQAHWFISFDNRFLKPIFSRHQSDKKSPAKERWRHQNLVRNGGRVLVPDRGENIIGNNDAESFEELEDMQSSTQQGKTTSQLGAIENSQLSSGSNSRVNIPIAGGVDSSHMIRKNNNNSKASIGSSLYAANYETPSIDSGARFLSITDRANSQFNSADNLSLDTIKSISNNVTNNNSSITLRSTVNSPPEDEANNHNDNFNPPSRFIIDSDEDNEPLLDLSHT